MGRRRTKDFDLPTRLFAHHGGYKYIHRVNGSAVTIWMGSDRDAAIARAEDLNHLKKRERLTLIGALRAPNAVLRQEVAERDGYRCVYCGADTDLVIDHFIPFSKGGATSIANLVLACQPCNAEKHSRDPIEFILDLLTYRDGLMQRAIEDLLTQRPLVNPAAKSDEA